LPNQKGLTNLPVKSIKEYRVNIADFGLVKEFDPLKMPNS